MDERHFDITADLDTPVSAYLKLAPFRPRFLLESVEGGERVARYSFLGFGDPHQVRLDGEGLWVGGERRPRPDDREGLLEALRGALASVPHVPGTCPVGGGLVGVAGYDLVRWLERLPPRPSTTPEAHYLATPSILVFDHLTRRAALFHAGTQIERAQLRREVIRALRGAVPPSSGRGHIELATPSLSREAFLDRVATVKEHIRAGDVFQLVLSVAFSGACDLEPFEVYRALRLLNPSPYLYFLDLGARQVIGSSPEALVKLTGRRATCRPIAGTRRRGEAPERDRALAAELEADPKENAEHVMLVDLARNDVGRVAVPGSVSVAPFKTIERYSHVMHLVSGVSAELAPGRDAFDLFAATFPAGTLVGAPKVRAMEIIDALEPQPRGIYGGTVGYFGARAPDGGAERGVGDMDQAICIRTVVLESGRYTYQAGAGIVDDSDPAAEHDEVLMKSAVMRRALELAAEGL